MQMGARKVGRGEKDKGRIIVYGDRRDVYLGNGFTPTARGKEKVSRMALGRKGCEFEFGKRKSDNVSLTAMLSSSLVLHERDQAVCGGRFGVEAGRGNQPSCPLR